jgi:hypothetical protein
MRTAVEAIPRSPKSLSELSSRAQTVAATRKGRVWMRVGRAAFTLCVVIWLAYELFGIGWQEVWASRPRTPWFYVAWLGLYVQLPIVEALVYRVVWRLPPRQSLFPLLHKRTLNQDVVTLLGEAYFFAWARRRLPLPDRQIAGTLKDNLIASSLAAWTSVVLLVLFTGQILLAKLVAERDPLYSIAAIVVAASVVALGVRFRRTLFTLRLRTVLALFAVHLGRFVLLVYVLQILQWWVVVPEAPLSLWVTMLVVLTIVSRLPFVPARDLVGIGAILGTPVVPGMLEAAVAAMLLTRTVLDKTCNMALWIAGSSYTPRSSRHAIGRTLRT